MRVGIASHYYEIVYMRLKFVVMTTYPAHYESVKRAEPKMGNAWAM